MSVKFGGGSFGFPRPKSRFILDQNSPRLCSATRNKTNQHAGFPKALIPSPRDFKPEATKSWLAGYLFDTHEKPHFWAVATSTTFHTAQQASEITLEQPSDRANPQSRLPGCVRLLRHPARPGLKQALLLAPESLAKPLILRHQTHLHLRVPHHRSAPCQVQNSMIKNIFVHTPKFGDPTSVSSFPSSPHHSPFA